MNRIYIAWILALAAAACGNSECDDANDRFEECGKEPVFSDDCSEEDACVANCALGSSCDTINTPDSSNYYYTCIAACKGG